MGLLDTLAMGAGILAGTQIGLRYSALTEPRPYPHRLAGLLDHPVRQKYRDPLQTVAPLGIAPGSTVLDLGCGTGLFTMEMARQVGKEGRVHAVDLQKPMLDRAQSRMAAAGLEGRVRFHHSGAYCLPLETDSVDIAVLISSFCEIADRLLALTELRRVIRPGGRIAISEELPHPAYLPSANVRNWLRAAGFRYGGHQGTPFCYTLLYFAE